MTSRLPSILPAYKDNKLYYFDDESLKARDYLYPSNYGMIPINIILDKQPLSCETYSFIDCNSITADEHLALTSPKTSTLLNLVIEDGDSIVDEEDVEVKDGCSPNGFIISFERLSNWYYKFKEYYHLLNDYGHCGVVYQSAQEYYENESKKYPQDMVYGTDEDTYIALDEELANMGACVTLSSYTEACAEQAIDEGFYKWICDNIIPTFTIPKPYQNYWNKTTLYYPDVISWLGWFEDRNTIFSTYTTVESCKELAVPKLKDECHYEEGDCCECKEYVNRGGIDMYKKLKAWYDSIQTTIENINAIVSANTSCFTPTVINPISMHGSLHTNGEMTVLCEEYEVGVDYRTASGFGATENESVGATVMMGDRLMRLVSGGGYTYDEKYMETIFDKGAWEDYPMDYSSITVSGVTSSKLKSIHVTNYLVDDVGNTIYAIYEPVSGRTNFQPPIYTTLEPIYQIGRIVNLTRIGTEDMFFGDVISSMTFYYMTLDDKIDESTMFSATDEGCISAITDATTAKESGETSGETYYDDIFCDVTYYVGNIYSGTGEQISEGVQYTETVNFVKEKVEYYLKKKNKIILPFKKKEIDSHSISYPIYIYTLKQKDERIDDNTYGEVYNDNLAVFNATIERPIVDDYSANTASCGEDNGTTISGDTNLPIFLEEFKLGTAAQQSVKGDIYIDRGINAAFEKHLKLGEVTTLEALIQYGNNFFKIMDK